MKLRIEIIGCGMNDSGRSRAGIRTSDFPEFSAYVFATSALRKNGMMKEA